ncbi:MAG: S8 family serine peptidase [Chloroflexi bacterium]|nr:S8 family serine peptidase [Chloroflexota bacterium]
MVEFSPRAHRAVWLLLTVLMLLSVPVFGTAAQEPVNYYFALGEQIPLRVSTRYVAVGSVDRGRTADAEGIGAVTSQLAQSFDALRTEALPLQPGLLAGLDFTLMPTTGVGSDAEALSLVGSLRTAVDPARWVNPVFERDGALLILTDEFVATFPVGTPGDLVEAYHAANGVSIVRQIGTNVYVLRVGPGVDALTMANRYHTGGVALHAEPNWALLSTPAADYGAPAEAGVEALVGGAAGQDAIGPMFTPNDTYYANGWHLNNYQQFVQYQSVMTFDADIDAKEAWDTQQGSASVVIAVLSDGVQTSHPDLDSKMVDPYDSIGGDNDPAPYDNAITRDWDAVGTHVAGLAAAESNNSQGITGVCMYCTIMPIRIHYSYFDGAERLLFTTIAAVADGIDWATDHGAAVLVNPWVDPAPSTTIADAFENAAANGRGGLGSVNVFAAGNSYQFVVSWPGRLASVIPGSITTGASTWCDTIKVDSVNIGEPDDCTTDHAWGNNWGTEIGISTPGHFLPSTDLTGTDGFVNGDYTGAIGGTAMSAAIAAGAAGLVISQDAGLTNDAVRDRLYTTADPLHTAGYDLASGWGRLNVQKAVTNTTTNTGTPNDHRASATTIATLPFSTSQSVIGAFVDRTDPVMACLSASQLVSNTVWYKFTPAYTMTVNANTFGSNYDTVLGVYDGALTSVACNNDLVAGVTQSQVNFTAVAGTTYNILVGDLTSTADPIGSFNPSLMALNVSTSTPPPSGQINGSVMLEGRPAPPNPQWSIPLHVVITPTAGGAPAFDGTITTGLSGEFTVSNLAAGNYNIWAKGTHTLANVVTVTISGVTPVNIGTLKEGDASNNNIVNIGDFSILAAAFGSVEGGATFDARADFNADDAINISDFSLLAANFLQVGADMP